MMLAGFRSRCSTPSRCAAAEPGTKLARDLQGLVAHQAADAPQQRGQVFAVHVFHGKKSQAVDFAHIVDAADVGVRNAARDADFVAEALQRIFVLVHGFGQKLQRHGLFQDQVVGAIDLAHAALAEDGDNPIASGQKSAGQEATLAGNNG